MSRGRFFNRPPMGPKQTREDANGISGPLLPVGPHPVNRAPRP